MSFTCEYEFDTTSLEKIKKELRGGALLYALWLVTRCSSLSLPPTTNIILDAIQYGLITS